MTTLGQALGATVRHNARRAAILTDERAYTWAELGARVARAAGLLAQLGVERGARFAILARNGHRYDELKWAGFRCGAIPVPVNWRLAPPEIAYILADADCRIVFADSAFKAGVGGAPTLDLDTEYEARLASAPLAPLAAADENDDAIVYYTGGTTGRAKGVRLSHRNILSCAHSYGLGVGARRDDVFLRVAPMFHSADLLATAWMLLGAAQTYMPAFSPPEFIRVAARHKPTVSVTVPAMLAGLFNDPGFARADVSSFRLVIFGASPMPVDWIGRTARAFPSAQLANCYGLTETAPDLTISDPVEYGAAIRSGATDGPIRAVGKPALGVELRIVGLDGNDVPPGEPGEIWARGPNIMKGYLNLPEETEKALAGGWLHTGDIGRIDADGFVYILDRLKDVVVTGGENVYATEVESALCTHSAVREAAVIGVPDDRLVEAVFAVVVAAPGAQPTADELIGHCRGRIGGYKIPRRMAFVDALPKSAMGKVLKDELRRRFAKSPAGVA